MYIKLSLFFSGLYIALLLVVFPLGAAEIDTSQLQKQCQNITQQQRQMAKAAGYDVDSVCASLGSTSTAQTIEPEEKQLLLPRDSTLVTSERGVIDPDSLEDVTVIEAEGESDASDELIRYGYGLFAGVPTTFAPATNIPVPVDYLVGPGDSMQIQLLGKINQNYEISVGRDGAINFPDLGPISVAGLKFSEAKQLIQQKVSEQMIGVRAVISLGELRSIQVFILGEAFKPGSYTVSSLSTMTNALFVSGGITDIGSLRKIQLKRQGKVITTLDLYDLLQRGDTSNDARLLPGDVIYIPPVGVTAGIEGEVKRPAIYELKTEKTLEELIDLAGGFSANAFPNISHITRKSANGFTTVVDVDLSKSSAQKTGVLNGDLVEISTVLDELKGIVTLSGNFHRERALRWRKGLKLSNVIHSANDFKKDTDLNIGLIVRMEMPLRKLSILHFDLQAIIENNSLADIELQPLDEVMSFAQDDSRLEILEPLLEKLMTQTSDGGLAKTIDISGNIRFPGSYPLTKNMRVRDLVILAGGLREASYLSNAEVTRRDLSDKETATVQHINVNLAEELSGIKGFELEPKDKLAVYTTPEYREHLTILLEGEVRFPGSYEFKRGESLSQVIGRAGGFTSMAHVQAAVFTREDLRIQEAKQLKALKERMREDIAASELENAASGKNSSVKDAESLLNALSETEALGRLVVSLEDIMAAKIEDIQLKDGDRLIVPTFRQEVSVLGEIQHATSHLFNKNFELEDYLDKSGGLTIRADDDRIYVVKADGSVFLPNQSGWLTHQNEMLSPGDSIIVPLDTDRTKALTMWSEVSQIIYQLALGAAAVNSF